MNGIIYLDVEKLKDSELGIQLYFFHAQYLDSTEGPLRDFYSQTCVALKTEILRRNLTSKEELNKMIGRVDDILTKKKTVIGTIWEIIQDTLLEVEDDYF